MVCLVGNVFACFVACQVIAVELDPRMVAELQKRVQGTYVVVLPHCWNIPNA